MLLPRVPPETRSNNRRHGDRAQRARLLVVRRPIRSACSTCPRSVCYGNAVLPQRDVSESTIRRPSPLRCKWLSCVAHLARVARLHSLCREPRERFSATRRTSNNITIGEIHTSVLNVAALVRVATGRQVPTTRPGPTGMPASRVRAHHPVCYGSVPFVSRRAAVGTCPFTPNEGRKL